MPLQSGSGGLWGIYGRLLSWLGNVCSSGDDDQYTCVVAH